MSDNEMKEILKMVEDGKITAEEASELLNALEADDIVDEAEADIGEASATFSREAEPNLKSIADKVRSFWRIPLVIGVVITVLEIGRAHV